MHKVTLSNDIEFECSPEQTILDAAKNNGIALEYSCRNGRCGVCMASVIEGETSLISDEEFLEEKREKHSQILTCCRSILSDIKLDIRDLGEIGLIKSVTLPCRINSIDIYNDEIAFLEFRLPPNNNFNYIPGQYIELINDEIRRSYSIANAPRDDNLIELHLKKVSDGVMSEHIFNKSVVNDIMRFEGPFGTFSLRDDSSKNIVFMATGTGIAPIKAILESKNVTISNKQVYVIWGGRTSKDIYCDLNNIDEDFLFIPVLSREKKDSYESGYVQQILLKLDIDLSDTTVYACGSADMIEDSFKLLVDNGLKPNNFHSDAFVSTA